MQSANPQTAATGHVLVFDSGIGGLTVREEIMALAPGLRVDYAADTGFFPYGDKDDAALAARVPAVAEALVAAARPDVFVIACNTASTLALDATRAALDIPVVGTVPAIKPAAEASQTGTIGLLATPGTLARDYTAKLIADFAAHCRVILHGSVELVHLAERSAAGDPVDQAEIARAQAPLFEAEGSENIDTVVLACTHFPLLREALMGAAPAGVAYIDSGAAIARQTVRILETLEGKRSADSGAIAWVTSAPIEDRLARVLSRYGLPAPTTVAVPSTGRVS